MRSRDAEVNGGQRALPAQGQIDQLGLSGFYNVLKSKISGINGTMFIFAGIRQNVSNIKSYESVDICWAEEAQNVNKSSWEVLIPTILRFRYPSTPSWKRTTLPAICDSAPPPTATVIKIGWRDNPYFPTEGSHTEISGARCRGRGFVRKKYRGARVGRAVRLEIAATLPCAHRAAEFTVAASSG